MLLIAHYLEDSIRKIANIRTNLEKKRALSQDDIDSLKTSIYGYSLEMLNVCQEAIFSFKYEYLETNSYNFRHIRKNLIESIKSIKETNDTEEIIKLINDIISPIEKVDFSSMSEYDYKDKFRDSYSYYGTKQIDDAFLSMLARRFSVPRSRSVSFLNPYATCASVRWAKSSIDNVVTYASNVPEKQYSQKKSIFDKVALGNMSGGVISNNAFDIMLLQPGITLTRTSERLIIKNEKDELRECIKYVRPGGYIIYIIPYFRFYKDICLSLSKYFSEIQVRKFDSNSFDETGNLIFVGKKNELESSKEVNIEVYKLLRNFNKIEEISDILDKEFEEMRLPEESSEIKTFRGSVLSDLELMDMLKNSPCKQQFFKKQEIEKLSEYPKNPLLPFSTGQLGLVLTSGCLDGIVDEGGGYYHVVKGRVVKKTDENRDIVSANEMELTETTSNRVEINILLPNGVHKTLA